MKRGDSVPVRVDGAKLQERLTRRKMTLQDAAYAVGVPYHKAYSWSNGGEIDPVKLYHLSRLLRCRMGDLVPDDWRDAVPDSEKGATS